MTIQTRSEKAAYKAALIDIIQALPVERLRQVVEYARLVQTQMLDEPARVSEKSKPIQRRRPHPTVAGKGRTLGDLVSPIVDEADWACLL